MREIPSQRPRSDAREVHCLACDRTYLAKALGPCPYCRKEDQVIGEDTFTKKVVDDNDLIK